VGYHQSVGNLETGVQSHRGDGAFPWPQRRCSSRLPGPIQSGGGQAGAYRSWPTTAGAADDRKLAATSIDNKFIRARPASRPGAQVEKYGFRQGHV